EKNKEQAGEEQQEASSLEEAAEEAVEEKREQKQEAAEKLEEEVSEFGTETLEEPTEAPTAERQEAGKEVELSEEDEHAALLAEDEAAKKAREEAAVTVEKKEGPAEKTAAEQAAEAEMDEQLNKTIFALRTTANREDQVMDFISENVKKKKMQVYSVIRPHGMRGYIFVEAESKTEAELAAQGIPYARGILPEPVPYKEIEHLLEQVKKDVDIRKSDIAEIISGPFKREQCKITRVDKVKEEVVVELLGAAVPIPITVKMDAVKVIRRESEEAKEAGEVAGE
ncbi:transcription elongation factor Spt5, partial [Candidatus Woesearchaeota archaeon]|nr:transcription elongation factor Spt5 [Candidatus Woesearchaeota archaeon]